MKVLLLVILLSGCTYQSVNTDDIAAAEAKCASEGSKIVSISANALGGEVVTCSNRKDYAI